MTEEEQPEFNEVISIENLKKGIKISVGSNRKSIKTLYKLSRQIKKDFFDND